MLKVRAYLRQHSIALLALFVALGGTSYAAVKLPKHSVGAAQLKNNAVTSPKVKNGSLLANDFKAGQLPRGPKGDAGQGLKGDTGPPGRSALEPLHTGETIRGVWVVGGAYPGNGDQLSTQVSFPIPAPVAVDDSHILVDGQGGETTCTGTTADPQAPPGYACVYHRPIASVSYSAGDVFGEPNKYGFVIGVQGNGSYLSVNAFGTWAYTAP